MTLSSQQSHLSTPSTKIFGTDGIRGRANVGHLTPQKMQRVAMAVARLFSVDDPRHPPTVVIGKDTRLSGYMIETALTSGFVASGMNVHLLGPVPTPAVAMLTRSLRATLGVMISASHNPFEDNGIKLFGPDGMKLTDTQEAQIETWVAQEDTPLADPTQVGRVRRFNDSIGRYSEYVKSTFPRGMRLNHLKIVVDCAHGAAYKVAPEVLWELGAEVITIGCQPNGVNINLQCGATDTQALQALVKQYHAHLGIALDGDADRLIMVDEQGDPVDGDQLLALIATSWQATHQLRGGQVVGTVMSNMGLEDYLRTRGLTFTRTKVGDRHILEAMQQRQSNLGGESSGHMILSDYNTTGDGLLAALQVLRVLVEQEKPFSKLVRLYRSYPQKLYNLPLSDQTILQQGWFMEAVEQTTKEMHAIGGRLLVRASGTEPLVRIMGEAKEEKSMVTVLETLLQKIRHRIDV